MASITSGRSFISGTRLLHSSFECDHGTSSQSGRSQSQMITCESSTAYNNSQKQKQTTELKSSVEEGGVQNILKNCTPRKNWWAPMFNFPSDGMWPSVLPEAEKQIVGLGAVTTPAAGVNAIEAGSISLPDLVASSNKVPTASRATLIRRQSTSFPGLIAASSQQKPNTCKKQVVFDDRKARELRRQLRVHETWHDGWVHSAIATRLAEPEV